MSGRPTTRELSDFVIRCRGAGGSGLSDSALDIINRLQARVDELEEQLKHSTASIVACSSAYRKHASRHRSISPRSVADPLFTTRVRDFEKAAHNARAALRSADDGGEG